MPEYISDVSIRGFLLTEEACHICGQDENLNLGYTLTEETEDDYFETEIYICRECIESKLDKYDSLIDELEEEIEELEEERIEAIAGQYDDLDEDCLTGC
jgi:Mg2+ and Co2+ transporter CorA